MSALIEGKVARILSGNVIVINVGAHAGVKPRMQFVVLMQGEEVKDPETGEALGRWEAPKGHLIASHVQERMSTCQGYVPGHKAEPEDPSTNVLSAALITHSMRPETWRSTHSAKLNVNRSEMAGMPVIGPISVGDVVRQVEGMEPPTGKAATAAKPDEKAAP